ncbi:MAG: hypothetical protein JO147_01035 [Actinobacteria bacterium]|nr:hypothetical protein [Actinomycetota bacterium]
MTIALALIAASALVWPLSRGTARIRGLIRAGRLAPVAPGTAVGPRLLSHLRALRPILRRMDLPGPALFLSILAFVEGAASLRGRAGAALPFAIAAGVAVLTGRRGLRRLVAARSASRRRRQTVAFVDLLAVELDAGTPAEAAWNAAVAAIDPGGRALRGPGLENVQDVRALWLAATGIGAPTAALVRSLRDDLSARESTRRAVAAALAGPRSSAALLAMLPVVGLGLGSAMGARPSAVLLGSATGRWLLCLGVTLDALGLAWMWAMVAKAEPP